jgi:succinate dehydrogenase/fumarate reductase flavoprotein subunit
MTGVETRHVSIAGQHIPMITANTVIVGTGAAGYCAAERLIHYGQSDVVMMSDRVVTGSSRNAGSDKQTYYKLTLAGGEADSVAEMAGTLFDGGAMDGDNALVEAALSPESFLHLVDLGVPFPRNRFGEFVGYKTDHDPRQRATSAGPYTSRSMVECLEAKVRSHGIRVLDNVRLLDLVTVTGDGSGGVKTVGLLGLRRRVTQEQVAAGESRFVLVRATSVVLASGGPAGMYARSVFPHGQWGASGAAYRAGAWGHNLTEWQFGLASIAPRWNVSGTYMQVLPTFISTNADGSDPREFLTEAIPDYGRQLSLIFLKGYQWPFDIRKARSGSSLIDLLVHRETVMRRRRVFLDFRRNPFGKRELDSSALSEEARDYLGRAGALSGTPVERLRWMNEPAFQLYRQKNPSIDLAREPLEIDVCVQHNNGGLAVDAWWQSTTLPGLFPVGEAAGVHGVYRPGGAALNSTQVGATRAAQWITARRRRDPIEIGEFIRVAAPLVERASRLLCSAVQRAGAGRPDTTGETLAAAQERMSIVASEVRSRESVVQALADVRARLESYDREMSVDPSSRRSVERLFLAHDVLFTQFVYLSAMVDYLERGGRSRGSVLYTDVSGSLPFGSDGVSEVPGLPEEFRFALDEGALDGKVQEVGWSASEDADGPGTVSAVWRERRPVPDTSNDFFEKIWHDYRENGLAR